MKSYHRNVGNQKYTSLGVGCFTLSLGLFMLKLSFTMAETFGYSELVATSAVIIVLGIFFIGLAFSLGHGKRKDHTDSMRATLLQIEMLKKENEFKMTKKDPGQDTAPPDKTKEKQ
ncbi:hypothetical protein ACFL27_17185 [candidate division CSSED10-310 bacterium]|uniref:Lipopolysaccharide assembly protein A domain-containing protein n=1 Tax=candidate division CSSED10-310 bacterium TaxID=2855610 RepID=A0ABV6Z0F6_UNCC1